jgi:hypothetical protein
MLIYGVPDAVSWEFFKKTLVPDVPQTLFQMPSFVATKLAQKKFRPKGQPLINYNRSKVACATPFK